MSAEAYDGRALALPVSESSSPSRSPQSPQWPRRSPSYRTSSPFANPPSSFKTRVLRRVEKLRKHAVRTYAKLSPLQRAVAVLVGLAAITVGTLFLIYNERIFGLLAPISKRWRSIPAGWLILWFLIFVVSFPPLVGYSSLLTIAGFVYGFPRGWYIAASATIIGSTVSFVVSRSVLRSMVHRLVAHDPRFTALSLTLKHDGIKLLIMIRLCPLPYSLSNGGLSTFPTVHWGMFALATAAASPKLLLHIFVGAKLGEIGEKGGEMDAKTKAISYLSALIGGLAGLLTGWVMYRQTKARAKALEAEERGNAQRASAEGPDGEYADDLGALEAAQIVREEEDDISLRETYRDETPVYRDDESSVDGDPQDVFKMGDSDSE